jgi:hypothetical protein
VPILHKRRNQCSCPRFVHFNCTFLYLPLVGTKCSNNPNMNNYKYPPHHKHFNPDNTARQKYHTAWVMQQATIQQLSLFLLPIREYLTPDTHICTIFKLRSRSKTFQLALRIANARTTVKNNTKRADSQMYSKFVTN